MDIVLGQILKKELRWAFLRAPKEGRGLHCSEKFFGCVPSNWKKSFIKIGSQTRPQ